MAKHKASTIELWVVRVAVLLFASIYFCVTPATSADLPAVNWKLMSADSPTHVVTTFALNEMIDRIKARTNGKFVITHHQSKEFNVDYGDHPFALSDNVVELSPVSTGHSAGKLPWIGIFQRPFLCGWPNDYFKLAKELMALVKEELAKMRITPISFYIADPVAIWTIKEVPNITDMGGVKLRVWDEASSKIAQAMGAAPVVMNAYEVYVALQRGALDGGVTGAAFATSESWYDFCKHGYLVNLPPNTYWLSYNNAAFNKLPKEYQNILLEEAQKLMELNQKDAPDKFKTITSTIVGKGVKLHEISESNMKAIAAKLKPQWQEWASKSGPLAQKQLDIAIKTLDR